MEAGRPSISSCIFIPSSGVSAILSSESLLFIWLLFNPERSIVSFVKLIDQRMIVSCLCGPIEMIVILQFI